MTRPRPLAAILAIGLLEVIALGCLSFTGLVVALGAPLGDGDPAGLPVVLTSGLLALIGVLAVLAGIGLWRGAAAGWALGLAVGASGALGILTALVAIGGDAPLLVALALFAALLALLATPSVRRHAGLTGPTAR